MNERKEITIYDIAEAMGLSPSTISRGLNDHYSIHEDTREKIVKKAMEMRYRYNFLAGGLRRNRTNTIGLVVPRLDTYFMSNVISGMERVTNQMGYNLAITQSGEVRSKGIASIKALYDRRVAGLLISSILSKRNISCLTQFTEQGIPVVFLEGTSALPPPFKSVAIDNFKAAYELTTHLINQGCKCIAHVTPELKRSAYTDRLKGYKQALSDKEFLLDDDLVVVNRECERSRKETCNALLKIKPFPDAIFFSTDGSAVMCIPELKSRGIRIPDDVCVAGFNNDPLSMVVEPKLTTVNYPGLELGKRAASALIRLIENKPNANFNSITLRHELIVRHSSMRKCA